LKQAKERLLKAGAAVALAKLLGKTCRGSHRRICVAVSETLPTGKSAD